MLPVEIYFGFYRPWLKPTGVFGHVEAWFYTEDETWGFIDPRLSGGLLAVTHLHDEVEDMLVARFECCQTVLKMPYQPSKFRVPWHGPMTCAAVCGLLVGVRALTPAGLRRRLLARGAEVVKDGQQTEGRSGGQGSETA